MLVEVLLPSFNHVTFVRQSLSPHIDLNLIFKNFIKIESDRNLEITGDSTVAVCNRKKEMMTMESLRGKAEFHCKAVLNATGHEGGFKTNVLGLSHYGRRDPYRFLVTYGTKCKVYKHTK